MSNQTQAVKPAPTDEEQADAATQAAEQAATQPSQAPAPPKGAIHLPLVTPAPAEPIRAAGVRYVRDERTGHSTAVLD